ncbi:AMP binding enzyme [Ceratobasidium sp. AG-Ba]|nr:AMP binding enzyme [Ceratobasidium sp. AG-Ba]
MDTTPCPSVLPASDGSVTIDTVVDFHAEKNPEHVFAILYDVDTRAQTPILYKQLATAVHLAAHKLNPDSLYRQGTNIGILASTDSITYITLIQGAIRAGLVPFPISPRTAAEGIAHLLASTKTNYAIVGGSPAIDMLYKQVETRLLEQGHQVQLISLPTATELYPNLVPGAKSNALTVEPFQRLKPTKNDTVIHIVHSSGSTGLPRAVLGSQQGIFKNVINQPFHKALGAPGVRTGLMAALPFHASGMWIQSMASMYQGFIQVLFAPRADPVIPTPDITLQALSDTECRTAMVWPTFLEAWAEDDRAIAKLKKIEAILFGGGPLAERVGDRLVTHGVNIQNSYGGTEFGTASHRDVENTSHPCPRGYDPRDWVYFKLADTQSAQFIPQQDDQGSYEIIFVTGMHNKPFVLNTEIAGCPAYSTKDLVVQHPTKPWLWKLVGRADDQITLSNSEKINPGPIENTILKSPLIQFAVMFGREKSQTGVLIDLTPDARETYANEGRARVVDLIWPYVEQANSLGPTHARLAADTIVFTTNSRPVPRTAKGTISRSSALKAYAEEIENMYAALETTGDHMQDMGSPSCWKICSEVEAWIKTCVQKVLGHQIHVEVDLFQQGMDSLSAAIVTRIIKSSVASSNHAGVVTEISRNVIFSHPTVKRLANYLVSLASGGASSPVTPGDNGKMITEEIQNMIRKYDTNWSTNSTTQMSGPRITRESVVITGSNGGLGCYLLLTLLKDVNVDKIWALNRRSRDGRLGAKERQVAAFKEKLIDVDLLNHPKLSLLEADLQIGGLGLTEDVYSEIQAHATTIVHNAWQVDFNLTLQSFEPSINATRNLLNLAFNSIASTGPPRFLFVSSVSAAGFGCPERVLHEKYLPLEYGVHSIGYGRSKLVAEKLLESAQAAGLETCIARLGLLVGDKRSGAWSVKDWVPAIIASSVSIGCLPNTIGHASWIPLDKAALAIHELYVDRSITIPTVVHCAHPRPIPWSDMVKMFDRALHSCVAHVTNLEVVPFSDWNQRITRAATIFGGSEAEKARKYPSSKIQDMVDQMVRYAGSTKTNGSTASGEMGGIVALDMMQALALSHTLRSVESLDRQYVDKWIMYWQAKGLFV